jgi:DNA-binding NtrC family response regulator
MIAATNRDLKQLVADGRFREDLYYRLNVINIQLPPLRKRRSDVAALATHFLQRFGRENEKKVDRFSDAALSRIVAYEWPGNVRELENVVERAVVLADGPTIELHHLPMELGAAEGDRAQPNIPGSSMTDIERYAILKTLEACGGSTSKAAEVLGISVRKIQYKLHEYGSAPKSLVPAVAAKRVDKGDAHPR